MISLFQMLPAAHVCTLYKLLLSHPHRFPPATPHTKTNSTSLRLSHTSAARALGSSMDPYDDEIDSGSSDEESSTLGQSIMDEVRGCTIDLWDLYSCAL